MTINTAVLLVNLGSPASPHVADVRADLREFLMDGCVLDALAAAPAGRAVAGKIARVQK